MAPTDTDYQNQEMLLLLAQELQKILLGDPAIGGGGLFTNADILKYAIPNTETFISRNNLDDMLLFYLKNAIYSALIPDIRFFKVVNDNGTKKFIECPFPKSVSESYASSDLTPNATRPVTDFDLSRPIVQRRGQIGIKSFNWNYLGTDNFTAQRDIEAELSMTMDGMGALTATRANNRGEVYRLLDLLIQSDCVKNKFTSTSDSGTALRYNPGCYEIYVEAGFFINKQILNSIIKNMNFRDGPVAVKFTEEKITRAINDFGSTELEKMKTGMYLTVVDHSFNFGENGKVECNVTYRARSTILERQKEQNILISGDKYSEYEKTEKKINLLQSAVDVLTSNNPISTTLRGKLDAEGFQAVIDLQTAKDERDKQKEAKKELIQEQKANFMSDVLELITTETRKVSWPSTPPYDPVKLYGIRKKNILREFGVYGRSLKDTDLAKFLGTFQPIRDILTFSSTLSASGQIRNDDNLPFVFLGDVIDAVLTRAETTSGATRFFDQRYVLANMRVNVLPLSPTGNETYLPIAAIPICVGMLRSLIEKSIKSSKKGILSVSRFIELILQKIVATTLRRETISGKLISSNKNFKSVVYNHGITSRNPDPTTPAGSLGQIYPVNLSNKVLSPALGVQVERLLTKINNTVSPIVTNPTTGLLDIICITEESSFNFNTTFGDIQQDFLRFIPHFTHGQGYGLIKKVSLEKTDLPYQKETRLQQSIQAGDSDPDLYLTNFYNATFEMIGNDLCSLGGYIYFDPFGLAPDGSLGDPSDYATPSLAYIMGLGGVFIITKISHKMSPGKYTTSVKTRWENRGTLRTSSGGASGP